MGALLQVSGYESRGGSGPDALDQTIIATHRHLTDSQPILLEGWRALLMATHLLGPPTRDWSVPGLVDGYTDIAYGWEEGPLNRGKPVGNDEESLGAVELVCWGRVRGYAETQLKAAYSLGRLATVAEVTGDSTKYDKVRQGLDSATRALVIGAWNGPAGRKSWYPLFRADMPAVPDFVSFWKAIHSDPDKVSSLYDDTRARVEAERQNLATMAFILRGNDQDLVEM